VAIMPLSSVPASGVNAPTAGSAPPPVSAAPAASALAKNTGDRAGLLHQ
jgi:hypothetical protein